jgi:hypothetical protein
MSRLVETKILQVIDDAAAPRADDAVLIAEANITVGADSRVQVARKGKSRVFSGDMTIYMNSQLQGGGFSQSSDEIV